MARNAGKREEARTLTKLFRELRALDDGAYLEEVFEQMQTIIDAVLPE